MAKYIIEGGHKLNGRVKISGNKNSILPCLAASLLTEEEVVLTNVPNITDVEVMVEILMDLGAQIGREGDSLKVSCKNINKYVLSSDKVGKLRASVLLVGPLLARFGKADFSHPGGDVIGKRAIDLHLSGFEKLGYKVESHDLEYKARKRWGGDKDVRIFLELPTVTGTENLILAAVLKPGVTTLRNYAQEPHVGDLCKLLNQMGADIEGFGGSELTIKGVKVLNGTEFRISPDNMEFGTYAIAAAITRGEVILENCRDLDWEPIVWPLEKMGLIFEKKDDTFKVKSDRLQAISTLTTGWWPSFPTDLMSVVVVLATQSKGVSLLRDWVYESRMFFVDRLISMGASITIADPHRVLVSGPTSLYGRTQETPDIRAGMALVLASLVAEGKSTINKAELIERGYENVIEKLSSLGANINRAD